MASDERPGSSPLDAEILAAILNTVGALVVVLDPAGTIVRFNRACEEATEYSEPEVVGRPVWELLQPEDVDAAQTEHARLKTGGLATMVERVWVSRHGRRRRLVEWSNTALVSNGLVEYIVGIGIDITDRRRAEEAMHAIEAVGDVLANDGPTVGALSEVVAHLAGRFGYPLVSIYLREGDRLVLGSQSGYVDPPPVWDETSGVVGRTIRRRSTQYVPDVSVDADYLALNPTSVSEICVPLSVRGELLGIINVETTGTSTPLDERDVKLMEAVADRVASAVALGRKRQQLEVQAFRDALTGLANRALFMDRTDHAIAARARSNEPAVAVIFLDIDDFKTVNDGMGHAAGDELLCQIAARMRDALRAGDTIARLGGDEFAVLLQEATTIEAALEVADRLTAAVQAPFAVGGHQITVGASAGVAVGASSAQDLLRDADVAMYRAKGEGKGRAVPFAAHMRDAAIARLSLERELRIAVARGDFFLVYQPIVDIRTAHLSGVEALARWRHPSLGILSPATFMVAAEETGLIVPLGRLLLRQACRQAQAWQESGWPPLSVSVNLSARQVSQPSLVADVRSALADSTLDPRLLTLEVTESVLVRNVAGAVETLQQIRSLGVRIAIDDFGTGYSSLSYVKDLPLDVLKIDRSFIAGLLDDSGRAAVVETVFRLGRVLGLTTVAEGVETEMELAAVRTLGADAAQGYLFSPPMAPEELARFVRRPLALPA